MHEHPASVAVFMSDGHVKFTLPDGTSQDNNSKAHDATWADAGKHLPENVGDKAFEVIVIETQEVDETSPARAVKDRVSVGLDRRSEIRAPDLAAVSGPVLGFTSTKRGGAAFLPRRPTRRLACGAFWSYGALACLREWYRYRALTPLSKSSA